MAIAMHADGTQFSGAEEVLETLEDCGHLTDARDTARRLLVLLTRHIPATTAALSVLLPDPPRLATVSVLGFPHRSSTFVFPAGSGPATRLAEAFTHVETGTRDCLRMVHDLMGNGERITTLSALIRSTESPRVLWGATSHGRFTNGMIFALIAGKEYSDDVEVRFEYVRRITGIALAGCTEVSLHDEHGGRVWFPLRAGAASSAGNARIGAVTDAAPSRAVSSLSPRQTDVLHHMAKGASNSEIARELGVSANTVRIHRRILLETLGAHNAAEAIQRARDFGLLS